MSRKDIKILTKEEFEILEKVKLNPIFFATFISVIHPIKGKVAFNLYPYQKAVLIEFLRNRFNIIKKFRQGGLTELICLYCLWLASYHINKNILILSIKDRVAKKVLRRIKYMYQSLPDFLKTPVVNGKGEDIGTASDLEFATGSVITSIPTTEDAGRSEPASLVIIDEAAIIRMAGKIWAAIFPTLSTGGSGILNSTPYGVGNFYHETWVDALSGNNPFNPIDLKYYMHPDYTLEWYNTMKSVLGPRRTAQEIDGDFLTSGNTVFDLIDIREIEEELDTHPTLDFTTNPAFRKVRTFGGALRVYKYPEPNKKYFIGSDISTGRSKDYTTISCMDRDGEEMLSFRGKIPINVAAKLLAQLGKIYNNAVLAPESNDIGLGVATKLQSLRYKNLYYSTKILKEKGESKAKVEKIPGWYTSRKNRPIIISELEEDIRLSNLTIKDPFFCHEAYTFIYDEANRPVAMGKKSSRESSSEDQTEAYTDDTIFAKAIANYIRKRVINSIIIAPS